MCKTRSDAINYKLGVVCFYAIHAMALQHFWYMIYAAFLLRLYSVYRRLADHFGGKLHMGFIQIREKRNVIQVKFILSCYK